MKLTTFVTNVFKIAMGQGLALANTPALFWCENILNLNESTSNLARKYKVERIFCVYCCCLSSSWSAILVRVLSFVKYLLNYSCVLKHLFRYIQSIFTRRVLLNVFSRLLMHIFPLKFPRVWTKDALFLSLRNNAPIHARNSKKSAICSFKQNSSLPSRPFRLEAMWRLLPSC